MKSFKKYFLALAALVVSLFFLEKFNSVTAASIEEKVCPGSNYSCALWGAIEKGKDRGFIEDEIEINQ